MLSTHIIFSHIKKFFISVIYFFLGNISVVLPTAMVYLGFYYKWWDVDFIGGLFLYLLESLLFTWAIMFLIY